MANYNLCLGSLMMTAAQVEPRFLYKDNVKTDQIECYLSKLIDVANAQIISIKIPIENKFTKGTYIQAVNPVGTPYLNKQNNRVDFSIKAEDLVAEK